MTKKRLFLVFIAILGCFSLLELRLFWLMSDYESARETVLSQSTGSIYVGSVRPDITDRNGVTLTSGESSLYAVAFPKDIAGYDLWEYMPLEERQRLRALSGAGMPELFRLKSALPGYVPAKTVELKERYSSDNLLPHILGYLDSDGRGVCGIEYAFDDYLTANTCDITADITIDAVGSGGSHGFSVNYPEPASIGISLTIDSNIQRTAKAAAESSFEKGAVVVLDAKTGEILASVSLPDFSPNNLQDAMESDDSPFLNRAFSAYNAGSVFKPIVAAAAIEAGYEDYLYTCEGSIEVQGVTFSCNEGTAHGEISLREALCYSCNCYFVSIGSEIGYDKLYSMANAARIGSATNLAGSIETDPGNIPYVSSLESSAELANLCFGQGQLLVTPLQVAAYTAAIANGGVYTEPSLIKTVGEERCSRPYSARIMAEGTAGSIKEYLAAAVTDGTGYLAAPSSGTAAGKTGTAETGDGIIGWFSGFFPAEDPQYVITVMVEGAGFGYSSAAPVFSAVAEGISAHFSG